MKPTTSDAVMSRSLLIRTIVLFAVVSAVTALFPFPQFDPNYKPIGVLTPLHQHFGM